MQSNINNVCGYWHSQNVYRLAFHNLQTRKKSEMVQTVQIELSIYSSSTRSQIWINAYVTGHLWDIFYDSKT